MFLRATQRLKDGKSHRYFSVVENQRLPDGKVAQRQLLYLGEINDSQEAAWRKSIEVFDEDLSENNTLSLFPEDRELPPDALNAVQVKLSEMQLCRPRTFGSYWLGCELWEQLHLSQFWRAKLDDTRADVPWSKVLQLLTVSRLVEPGSEWELHRLGFSSSAMDQLLNAGAEIASKDRLYRCLDRVLPFRNEVFTHLKQRWKDLFNPDFDVLLYDLTSTYFEGECREIPKARHGYSRDGRPDCRQIVIALVVTTDGLPLAYEVLAGNTSDRTTLRDLLKKIENIHGKARRTWIMDRGIPSDAVLQEMRAEGVQYLVGTPKGNLERYEKALLNAPWKKVREGIEVKLLSEQDESLVLARSVGRQSKENAMRRNRLKKYFKGLLKLRRRCPRRDRLLERLGVLKAEAGRAAKLVELCVPRSDEEVTPETFSYRLRLDAFKAAERRDGQYLLRTNLTAEDPAVLWQRYMQLTEIEAAFKCLKSDLALRPIHHQKENRVEAHVFVAFQAYCLLATLRKRLEILASGLTPREVLKQLGTIQMIDVRLPTSDGRCLLMPRYTQPNKEQQLILKQMKLELPAQPPPRISAPAVIENNPVSVVKT
jgi:transposase